MRHINLEYHPHDSRIRIADDDICQTLNQRMGTGGNNVPLIVAVNDIGDDSDTETLLGCSDKAHRDIPDH